MEDLIKEGGELKAAIAEMTAHLRAINLEIAENMEFGNKKSSTITEGGWSAKVTQRENIKWDQKRLEKLRSHVGDEDFFSTFKVEFKPIGAKALEISPFLQEIQFCRTVTPGAPSVVYKEVEQDG